MTKASFRIEQDFQFICEQASSELAELSGKTVYITGGGGFLGYYLTLSLLHWNRLHPSQPPIHVEISDIFKFGVPGWVLSLKDPRFKAHTFDAGLGLPAGVSPHFIFHGASFASPVVYQKYPIETIEANIKGLSLLLRYAAENRKQVQSLIYFSSSEIYGDPTPDQIPTPEDYRGNVSCTGPRACYDESKRLCEALSVSYFYQHQVPVKIVRPFNNYGPGLHIRDGRILADFARAICEDRNIVLLSDGSPRRTFTYIADAVVGYFKALVRGNPGQPYNIGNPNPEISMAELANQVVSIARECFDYTGKVEFGVSENPNYLKDNPQRRCPDIRKAQAELGFQPQIELDRGIRSYLLWARGGYAR